MKRHGQKYGAHLRMGAVALLVACALAASCGAEMLAGSQTLTGTMQFGGDVLTHEPLLDDAYDEASGSYDFTHMFAPVAAYLAETDLTVLNLEVPVASGPYGGYPRFNSPPALLDAIVATGTDAVLLANNHALDRLGRGARQTIEAVEAVGLAHVGTARNREEYNAVPMFDVGGIQVALFNYTQHTNQMEKQDDEANLRYAVHYFAVHRAAKDVEAARAAGADYVVMAVHWGKEYERVPTDGVRAWAAELADVGVDLVVGGHPHVLQPAEWVRGGGGGEAFVVYSVGNFLSGQREAYTDTGGLFRFTLVKDAEGTRLEGFEVLPTWVMLENGRYQVVPAEGHNADAYQDVVDMYGADRGCPANCVTLHRRCKMEASRWRLIQWKRRRRWNAGLNSSR